MGGEMKAGLRTSAQAAIMREFELGWAARTGAELTF